MKLKVTNLRTGEEFVGELTDANLAATEALPRDAYKVEIVE